MGFRFRNLNPIYKSLSRLSSTQDIRASSAITKSLDSQFQCCPPYLLSDNPSYNIPRRWHLGHSHDRQQPQSKEAERIFLLGLSADIGLAGAKALTGYLSGSTAIIADAAHSVSDVDMGFLSTTPELVDHSLTHAQGHNHSHGGHHHGLNMDHPILALNMAIVSICVKEGLYWVTKRAGERQGSGLMKANAWHHRVDAISSVVALIGVGGSIIGVKYLDPLAGVVVSGMILKAGLETGYQSILELVDAAIPAEQLDRMRKTILRVEGVKGCHRLRGRRAGSSLYLDVHIVVDPFSSVSAAHAIGENVRHHIHKFHPEVTEVFVHIDPEYIECLPTMMKKQESMERRTEDDENVPIENKNIQLIVSEIFASRFQEKMSVDRVTQHVLQGQKFLQVEVSMPPDMMIGEAMEMARQAEKEILGAVRNVVQVSIQLRLGAHWLGRSK